jgi:L-lactate dehydrogenase (cytochrome)
VVKALALGADGCSVGRPYLYGLAAAGEAGVDRALTLLRDEFEQTLMLTGVNDVARLERRHVRAAAASWRDGSRPAS